MISQAIGKWLFGSGADVSLVPTIQKPGMVELRIGTSHPQRMDDGASKSSHNADQQRLCRLALPTLRTFGSITRKSFPYIQGTIRF